VAALGRRYRLAAVTGVAGCFGFATLDAALIFGAAFLLAPVSWVTTTAIAASFARIAVTARALRPPWPGSARPGRVAPGRVAPGRVAPGRVGARLAR